MSETVHRYGWIPDKPDNRDRKWFAGPRRVSALPPMKDLRPTMPPVYDQLNLGSCTANAAAAMCWFVDKTNPFNPSRLFIYYNTRVLEGTVSWDSGASIRNSVKSVVRYGFCPESLWPYRVADFKRRPSAAAYDSARRELATSYARVTQSANQLRACLAEGFPISFGFSVYESFEGAAVAQTGMVSMPAPNEAVLGGHAVLLVGYDDSRKLYIVRNSWGPGWGDLGYCYMPYDFVHSTGISSDFWTIRAVV